MATSYAARHRSAVTGIVPVPAAARASVVTVDYTRLASGALSSCSATACWAKAFRRRSSQ